MQNFTIRAAGTREEVLGRFEQLFEQPTATLRNRVLSALEIYVAQDTPADAEAYSVTVTVQITYRSPALRRQTG